MLNIMEIERIEHEEAQRACEGTRHNWTDMLDWQSLSDLRKSLKRADAEQCRKAFREYFETLIINLGEEDE